MTKDTHFLALENMYRAAPINDFYSPTVEVLDGEATIEIEVTRKMFHAAGTLHGSVYFKMLDDAAFFAANSRERRVFVVTSSFTTYLLRPVTEGPLRSVGRVVNESKSQFIAEAVAYDDRGREVARGSGVFVRSRSALGDVDGYGT